MSSPNIRSVAADSNVLLSAIAGRAARRVFAREELIVVTTKYNIAEVMEYLPVFAKRYGIAEDLVVQALALLPIEVYSRPAYADQLTAARALLSGRDEDDAPLAGLAMTLRISPSGPTTEITRVLRSEPTQRRSC